MITLGRLVEQAAGASLEEHLRRTVFEPLGMKDTGYRPDRSRCAPTRPEEPGTVHDPLARAYLSAEHQPGNAGLFSTGDDLAIFCQALLSGRLLKPETLEMMFTADSGLRGLGWRMWGKWPYRPGVGHTGFTGTLLWLDPPRGKFAIVLTNGVYPGERAHVDRLREAVLKIVNR